VAVEELAQGLRSVESVEATPISSARTSAGDVVASAA
jgi:hypothetical protein